MYLSKPAVQCSWLVFVLGLTTCLPFYLRITRKPDGSLPAKCGWAQRNWGSESERSHRVLPSDDPASDHLLCAALSGVPLRNCAAVSLHIEQEQEGQLFLWVSPGDSLEGPSYWSPLCWGSRGSRGSRGSAWRTGAWLRQDLRSRRLRVVLDP